MCVTSFEPDIVVDQLMTLFEELHHNLAGAGVLVEHKAITALVMEINVLLAGLKGRGSEAAFWQAKLNYLRYEMTQSLPNGSCHALLQESQAAL